MRGGKHTAEVRRWLDVADHDLAVVRLCLRLEPLLAEAAAYHCQQALEKIAKAYLVLVGVRFRKTHSIDELVGYVERLDKSIADELTRLAWVTAWGVAHRYPYEEEPEPVPTWEEIEDVFAATETLRIGLEARLRHQG